MSAIGLLLASLTAPRDIAAQVLAGAVLDGADRRGVPDCPVRVVRTDSGPEFVVDSATTSAIGSFRFELRARGAYRIALGPRATEWRDARIDTLAAGDVVSREFVLDPAMLARASGRRIDTIPARPRALRIPRMPTEVSAGGDMGSALLIVTILSDSTVARDPAPVIRSTGTPYERSIAELLPLLQFVPASIDGKVAESRACFAFSFYRSADRERVMRLQARLIQQVPERDLCRRFQ